MFKGSSRNTVDAKGRITVPVRWRGELSENLVVMYGLSNRADDKYLQLMNLDVFEKTYGGIASSSMYDSAFGRAKRFILSNAEDVNLDKSDRLLIPQHLIKYAGLGGEILLFGVGDHVEIWDPERYARSSEGYGVVEYSIDAKSYSQLEQKLSPISD
jgi:MraZ protein